LGPPQFPPAHSSGQPLLGLTRRPCGCCRCLLKGCERWFRPARPQARYCCADCRNAALRWRRQQAARRYRASPQGKLRRRLQSQRYRQRQAAGVGNAAEGQRPATNPHAFLGCPCQRPGCYDRFVPRPRSPGQHFCKRPCRQALRRVRQRQLRRLERRRRGVRPRRRGPPTSPS
jgi:hypothetical protein